MAVLEVKNLTTYFYTREGVVKAVDAFNFTLEPGMTLGIVGESGSGKSVSVCSLLGLIPKPPGRIVAGQALYRGADLLQMSEAQLRRVRGKKIAMIFQDPMTSLNPYLRISTQLTEVLATHTDMTAKQQLARAIECMQLVGIPNAAKRLHDYPHQFSGGMRQRVMIAMALITNPDILIADEPTTALDVTIQAQILDLLVELQREIKMSVIVITHDLGVIARLSDRIIIMYAGNKVEEGDPDDIFYRPLHPYTIGLLASLPRLDVEHEHLPSIPGTPPDLVKLAKGCVFAPRCPHRQAVCVEDRPIPIKCTSSQHTASCHWSA